MDPVEVVALTEAGAPQQRPELGAAGQRLDGKRESELGLGAGGQSSTYPLRLNRERRQIDLPSHRRHRQLPVSYEGIVRFESRRSTSCEVLPGVRFQQHYVHRTLPCSSLLSKRFPTSCSAGLGIGCPKRHEHGETAATFRTTQTSQLR
jgi:hypothetical protein